LKNLKVLFLIPLLLIWTNSYAASGAQREAERLLNTMGMATSMNKMIENVLNMQMQQKPVLAPYKGVMLKFFRKYMSYESLKPDLIAIYADVFTEGELKKINEFYMTDTGKKTIRILPTLAQKGSQLGMQRVQTHMGELQDMIKAEAARIQKNQPK